MRHRDFERIRNEFVNYYKNPAKGEYEYYSWLKALSLDESLPYNQTHESFQWAKDMISYLREDKDNKYYRVLCAFPIKSMNGNVYRERDLIAAAMSMEGACPSLNHKDEFWFSPENPRNKWGNLEVVKGKYEDGAVECILKVPKSAVCPICNGDKMTELIDKKRIVNVSLEGGCVGGDPYTGQCEGFTFNKKTFSLLTSDVLPGIPLARIFPIESYLPFSRSSTNKRGKKRMVKVIGLKEKRKVGEPFADYTDFADCVSKNQDKEDPEAYCAAIQQQTEQEHSCPEGSHWDSESQQCVADKIEQDAMPENQMCPDDQHWDSNLGQCVDNSAEPEGTKFPPELAQTAVGTSVAPDTGRQIQGESAQLKVDKLKLEQKVKGYEMSNAELTVKLEEAYAETNEKKGIIKTHEATISKLEKQTASLNSEKSADQTEIKRLNRALEDMMESRDSYKRIAEDKTALVEELTKKYKNALETNVALNRDLTKANEDYIGIAKDLDRKEEALKKSKSLATKIRAIGLNETK